MSLHTDLLIYTTLSSEPDAVGSGYPESDTYLRSEQDSNIRGTKVSNFKTDS